MSNRRNHLISPSRRTESGNLLGEELVSSDRVDSSTMVCASTRWIAGIKVLALTTKTMLGLIPTEFLDALQNAFCARVLCDLLPLVGTKALSPSQAEY